MSAAPRRLEKRRAHIDAAAVPIERALIARAEALEESEPVATLEAGPEAAAMLQAVQHSHRFVAAEFRRLAEELHWW